MISLEIQNIVLKIRVLTVILENKFKLRKKCYDEQFPQIHCDYQLRV